MDPQEMHEFLAHYSGSSFDDLEKAYAKWLYLTTKNKSRGKASSSIPRRPHAYIDREREKGHDRLVADYFSENPPPVYPDAIFRRRFRMRRTLFLRIVNQLESKIDYFIQKPDATGKLGLSSLKKCTAAIRMLAYGVGAYTVDEYLQLGESTARLCLSNFVDDVIASFGDTYLRRPNTIDIQHLHVSAQRGFLGMIDSIDCMHWEWKNCPTAWKDQFEGKDGKPTIVLESVASYDLWIWHAFFGTLGTCNDINVLDRSPVFDDVLQGISPPVCFEVNGNQYNMSYYLVDGIYPNWAIFIPSIKLPQGEKAKLFITYQEATQ